MKWKCSEWCFLVLWLLVTGTIHTSFGQRYDLNFWGQGEEGLRRRGLPLEKDQARFLRKLLETAYVFTRPQNKERQQLNSQHGDDEAYFTSSLQRRPVLTQTTPQKPKGRKRWDSFPETNSSVSCCPQRYEVIEPNFGRNRTGHIVELYKDERIQQRFYELVCAPSIEDEPCRFLQGRNYKLSRCTQQHAYTYALVQSNHSLSGWSLDHIRIRSGCVCKVYHPSDKFRRKKTPDGLRAKWKRQ